MDIFTALRSDHEKQRLLMQALVETTGESASRKDFFNDLKTQLSQHSTAEERYFYAPLMEVDDTVQVARHAIAEHHEIDELIEQLEQTEMSSPTWLKTMKDLKHKVLHHLAEEEKTFFQQAGKHLSSTQKTELANQYQAEMSN
ncbi:hemerythrin domain-containing protein [Colwellia sp. E2M01]|uniref:hemerythrin domain-containing protein n=1 Tax=Colwellia sp. E2M01 TaxID=2841561 RepID=UPI001C07F4D0|nr:hemerythrin domain-containing protein [Colwellia sp. E2M01]MBU2869632.1 hemerythrin domain-containing protein [Colwellia sp. E2M01]